MLSTFVCCLYVRMPKVVLFVRCSGSCVLRVVCCVSHACFGSLVVNSSGNSGGLRKASILRVMGRSGDGVLKIF